MKTNTKTNSTVYVLFKEYFEYYSLVLELIISNIISWQEQQTRFVGIIVCSVFNRILQYFAVLNFDRTIKMAVGMLFLC